MQVLRLLIFALFVVTCSIDGWLQISKLQISHKYGLIYVITKLGLLFVYDLETATAVYRNRISPDPIFLTAEATSVGGFYAVNRRGQVLLATVNEQTLVPFVSGQVCFINLPILYGITYFIYVFLVTLSFIFTVEQFRTCRKSGQKRKSSWCWESGKLTFYTIKY